MKIPNSIWSLLIGIVLTLVSLWYGQNHGLLPTAASDEAVLIDGLFNAMLTVSIGIFLLVEGVLIYAGFRYRRREGDNEDGSPIDGNVPLEILWTAIPAIIVIGISVYSFDVYNEMGGFNLQGGDEVPIEETMSSSGTAIAATLTDKPATTEQKLISQSDLDHSLNTSVKQKQPPLIINVTALQYAWLFTYPNEVLTGELHIPVGQAVQMKMTASDVIHAFWVPQFRLKQDVIPGKETEVRFRPTKIGTYPLICAELCGPYHGVMQSQVVVESQADFDSWMEEELELAANPANLNQAVASQPAHLSADQFLTPYTKNMGVDSEILHQIQH